MHKVVTDTTRSPCKGEVDKVHYNFVSEQFFRDNIDSYVEYNEYDNHLYGSNGTRIADALDGGKADAVICLDINGAKALKNHYGEQVRVIYVHRDIEKIYVAIDERVANGEITAKSAVRRKDQVLRDIESRNDPVIDFEVDNNGALVNTIAQIEEIMQRWPSEVEAKLFEILQNLSVINRDNGKRFTCTDRLEAISSILWNSKYRRINCDGLFNLYSAKSIEQLSEIELTVVSGHVDCEQNITSIDEKMLCGTYDNSITNASIYFIPYDKRHIT